MIPEQKDFYELAQKLKRLLLDRWSDLREGLEATLLPMVRCAIRTGLGQPVVVNWVKHQLGSGRTDRPLHPDQLVEAVPLARKLSEIMLPFIDPVSGRETIVGF
jgi:hypothetical protein